MVKIVLCNQKGGTGKTFSTVSIAGCLEKEFGKKVLIVDCDSQINCTSYLLTHHTEEIKKDILTCLKKKSSISETIIQSVIPNRVGNLTKINIFIVPGSRAIDTYNVKDISLLKDMLSEIEEQYDYCLFDCPPHLSDMELAALAIADYVLVPAIADVDSLGGYDFLLDTINQIRDSGINISIRMLGIFFNNVKIVEAAENFILSSSKENMKNEVFKTFIRSSSAVKQARIYGKPINYYKRSNNTAKDCIDLTKEILERIEKEKM